MDQPQRSEDVFDVVVVGARVAGQPPPCCSPETGSASFVVDRSPLRRRHAVDPRADARRGPAAPPLGTARPRRAAGTPPVPRTTFRYQDAVVPITINPPMASTRCTRRGAPCSIRILVDAAAEAGVEVRSGAPSPGWCAIAAAGPGVRDRYLRRRPSATIRAPLRRRRRRHPVDGRPRWSDAPLVHRGRPRPAPSLYGYSTGLADDGYEWIFRPDAAAGLIPTNGGQVCVFVSTTPARIGRGGRTSSSTPSRRCSAGRHPADSTACRRRRRPPPARFARPARLLRRAWGPAGRWSATPATSRTRQRPRHDRRPARRRAPRPRPGGRLRRRRRGRCARQLPGDP